MIDKDPKCKGKVFLRWLFKLSQSQFIGGHGDSDVVCISSNAALKRDALRGQLLVSSLSCAVPAAATTRVHVVPVPFILR